MNIVLIGGRCVGKTTIARELSVLLQRNLYDTDALVEYESGMSIPAIIDEHDWGYFRDIEYEVCQKLNKVDNAVIATGGGIVVDLDDNGVEEYSPRKMELLQANSMIVWLKASIESQLKYLKKSDRPSLTGTGIAEELPGIMKRRTPFYEKAAQVTIDTSNAPLDVIAKDLAKKVQEG